MARGGKTTTGGGAGTDGMAARRGGAPPGPAACVTADQVRDDDGRLERAVRTGVAASLASEDARRAAAALREQAEPKREDQQQCPTCGHWGCPARHGTFRGKRATVRYRECGACGHRFKTRQAHGRAGEERAA